MRRVSQGARPGGLEGRCVAQDLPSWLEIWSCDWLVNLNISFPVVYTVGILSLMHRAGHLY